jgi:hypothetical protein
MSKTKENHVPPVPLALRPDAAASALGISRSTLMRLVEVGKIRRPVVLLRGIVLFDFERLRDDWEALRDETLAANDDSPNPWDAVL